MRAAERIRRLLIVFLAGLLLAAIAALTIGIGLQAAHEQSIQWQIVEGRLLTADIENRAEPDGERTVTLYSPVATYDYKINGIKYIGNRIWLSSSPTMTKQKANEIVEKLKIREPFTVRVNRELPNESCLMEDDGHPWMVFAGGIMSLVIVCLVLRVNAGKSFIKWFTEDDKDASIACRG